MSAIPRYDVVGAGKALRRLLRNPDDLPQVFVVVEALQGPALQNIYDRLMQTEDGRKLLEEEPDVVPLLTDRERLRALPEGSLGRTYLAFVEREGISAEGIIEASLNTSATDDDHLTWVRNRLRDTHDLWHAVTGYQGDVLGELSILGFILAQNFQLGIFAMLTAAFAKGYPGDDGWLVIDGYVRGKRAAWLHGVRWEELLPLPIEEVRARLKVGAPRDYVPMRSSEMRARGVLPTIAA